MVGHDDDAGRKRWSSPDSIEERCSIFRHLDVEGFFVSLVKDHLFLARHKINKVMLPNGLTQLPTQALSLAWRQPDDPSEVSRDCDCLLTSFHHSCRSRHLDKGNVRPSSPRRTSSDVKSTDGKKDGEEQSDAHGDGKHKKKKKHKSKEGKEKSSKHKSRTQDKDKESSRGRNENGRKGEEGGGLARYTIQDPFANGSIGGR